MSKVRLTTMTNHILQYLNTFSPFIDFNDWTAVEYSKVFRL